MCMLEGSNNSYLCSFADRDNLFLAIHINGAFSIYSDGRCLFDKFCFLVPGRCFLFRLSSNFLCSCLSDFCYCLCRDFTVYLGCDGYWSTLH